METIISNMCLCKMQKSLFILYLELMRKKLYNLTICIITLLTQLKEIRREYLLVDN